MNDDEYRKNIIGISKSIVFSFTTVRFVVRKDITTTLTFACTFIPIDELFPPTRKTKPKLVERHVPFSGRVCVADN